MPKNDKYLIYFSALFDVSPDCFVLGLFLILLNLTHCIESIEINPIDVMQDVAMFDCVNSFIDIIC